MISSTQAWSPTSSPTAPTGCSSGNVVYLFPGQHVGASTFTISSTGSGLDDGLRQLTRAMKAAARRLEHWDFIRSRCGQWEYVVEPDPVILPRRVLTPRYHPRVGLGIHNWSDGYRRGQ